MSIWSSIFSQWHGDASLLEIRPSGLLMDADGWYYEESLDTDSPERTIRVQQDRPGDWYVRNTNCNVDELNSPSRAAEVLDFFTGSFRWLRFERESASVRGPEAIKIVGTFVDSQGGKREAHIGYVEPEIAGALSNEDVDQLWGRIRCIKLPAAGRRPTFFLRFDLLVELEEGLFDADVDIDARPEDFLPAVT